MDETDEEQEPTLRAARPSHRHRLDTLSPRDSKDMLGFVGLSEDNKVSSPASLPFPFPLLLLADFSLSLRQRRVGAHLQGNPGRKGKALTHSRNP